MTTKPDNYYSFVVFRKGAGQLFWSPPVAGKLETVMVTAYQRGGLTGEFKKVNEPEAPNFERFIVFDDVAEIWPRTAWEAMRVGVNVEKPA